MKNFIFFLGCFFVFNFLLNARPNILFIYTDDQSSRTVGCYPEAYSWVKTPHIDALAKEGVRFEQAYIGTWCMPSRATILTGKLQHNIPSLQRVGLYPNAEYDPEVLKFWPSVFREHGYKTAHIGKWHTGNDTGYGRDWDFQAVWIRPEPSDKNAGTYYRNQRILWNGKVIGNIDGYATDNYTKWAIDFLNEHREKKEPWVMWLCYTGVHGPFDPAMRHREDYPGLKVPIPEDIYPERKGKPTYSRTQKMWVPDKNGVPISKKFGNHAIHDKTIHGMVRQYHQAVRSIDESVGKLMNTLKKNGQYENTLIIYTSDQGFAWGQHGSVAKKAPYAANIKAPLIFHMPQKIASGKVCNAPANGSDIAPTLFHFANIESPWAMDGYDLSPQLKKPSKDHGRPILMSYTSDKFKDECNHIPEFQSGVPWYSFVVKDDFKFIQTLIDNELPELYDLKNDPGEMVNLALNPEFRPMVKKYHSMMLRELKRTDAGFADELPKMKGFED